MAIHTYKITRNFYFIFRKLHAVTGRYTKPWLLTTSTGNDLCPLRGISLPPNLLAHQRMSGVSIIWCLWLDVPPSPPTLPPSPHPPSPPSPGLRKSPTLNCTPTPKLKSGAPLYKDDASIGSAISWYHIQRHQPDWHSLNIWGKSHDPKGDQSAHGLLICCNF